MKERLWPVRPSETSSLSELLEMIETVASPYLGDIPECEHASAHAHLSDHDLLDPKINLLQKFADYLWAGLCLDCFKNRNGGNAACRVAHSKIALKRDVPTA